MAEPVIKLHRSPDGGAGLDIFAGQLRDWLDENTKTRGYNWAGRPGVLGESYKMQVDAFVRQGRDATVNPLLAAYWDVEEGADTPLGKEIASFVAWNLFDVLPWQFVLQTACNGYIRDGVALFEKTEDVIDLPEGKFPLHPGKTQGVALNGLHYRPTWTIAEWRQAKDPSKLKSVLQYLVGSDVEKAGFKEIASEHLLRFTWEQEGANFEGNSIYRSVWGYWFAKRILMRIELISHEKNHVAQPFIEMPNETDVNQATDDLERLAADLKNFRAHHQGYHLIPPGYAVNFKSGAANTPIRATIDALDFAIMLGFGAAFLLLGRKSTGAGYALAETQAGQHALSLQKHASFIETVFNVGMDGHSIIKQLVMMNYGPNAPVPKLKVRNLPTVDWKSALPVVYQGLDMGALKMDDVLDTFIRKVLMLPKADPATQREMIDLEQRVATRVQMEDPSKLPTKKDDGEDNE